MKAVRIEQVIFPVFFAISLLIATALFFPYYYCHLVIALIRQHILTPSIFQVGGFFSEEETGYVTCNFKSKSKEHLKRGTFEILPLFKSHIYLSLICFQQKVRMELLYIR